MDTDLTALHSFTHWMPTENPSVLSPVPDPGAEMNEPGRQPSGVPWLADPRDSSCCGGVGGMTFLQRRLQLFFLNPNHPCTLLFPVLSQSALCSLLEPVPPEHAVKQPARGKPGELELRELRGISCCGQGGPVKPAPGPSHSTLPFGPQSALQKLSVVTLCPQTGILVPKGSPVPYTMASPCTSVLELIPLPSPQTEV